MRTHLRDAQLDLLIASHRDGMPGAAEFSSREAISDYLLTDVQMSPCMTTSRIQFAYAAVQRYVAVAQRGRAHWITRTDDQEKFAREWISLRQYRLHEAQMRILVHTENWIDPALRPTKTPAFERLEQTMNSGPLTLQLAEQVIKAYAADLTEIARLEPVAIVTHEGNGYERPLAFRDSELYGTHVFARTRAHPQRLYYRRRLPSPDERWTPWELVDNLEGTHYLAVVVFGRLRLICADFSVARSVRPERCSNNEEPATDGFTPAGQGALTDYEVTLSWIDREYGRWSQVKRSERFPFSIKLDQPPNEHYVFERARPSHFGEIVKNNSWVTRVTVSIGLMGDGMNSGSQMHVFLKNLDNDKHNWFEVGILDGPQEANDRTPLWRQISPRSIPDNPRLDAMTQIRLEWVPSWQGTDVIKYTDDCNVVGLQLVFHFKDGLSHHVTITEGLMGRSIDTPYFLMVPLGAELNEQLPGMRFQGGGHNPDASNETPWPAFEAEFRPVNLDSISPQQSYFDMEWELVPQSVDLSRAITLQVTENTPESFDLTLFSVPHKEDGRIRSRFKVKDQGVPEEAVNVWGTDWVNGKEFCYSIQTDHAACARLRIHADDTIEEMVKPVTLSLGHHKGTKPVGQALLSVPKLERLSKDPFSNPVYGDERVLAKAPVAHSLTVQRTQILYSGANPKILDETHGSRAFARTFFLERVGRAPFPANASIDPSLVTEIDIFADHRIPPPKELDDAWNVSQGIQTTHAATHVAHNNQSSSWGDPAGALAPGNPLYFSAGAAPFFIRNIPLLPFGAPTQAGLTTAFMFQWISTSVWGMLAEAMRPGIWRFHTFWHPQAVGFRRVLEAHGLPRLVRVENQALLPGTDLGRERNRIHHFSAYHPTDL
ncbi:neuraminidase-like domain-containing protein [Nitrosomonas europaea]|uniref:neuraminidase-like domain-containing protein n=1 Tax=Nitrosomonas europaea TaxID=915 RepID=UPI0032638F0D